MCCNTMRCVRCETTHRTPTRKTKFLDGHLAAPCSNGRILEASRLGTTYVSRTTNCSAAPHNTLAFVQRARAQAPETQKYLIDAAVYTPFVLVRYVIFLSARHSYSQSVVKVLMCISCAHLV